MKYKSICFAGLAVALSVFVSGCASYEITPSAASITAPKAASPIPVTVGISQVEQKVTGGFPDMVPPIKRCLDDSALFREVLYPIRPSDKLDGEVSLRLSARFQADGALFPKSFFTGFFLFLPAPIITYDHQYQAECSLELFKGGQLLKTYSAKAAIDVSHKLFAPPDRIEAEGTEAAVKLLGANLVGQLIQDRAFLESHLVDQPKAAAQL